MRRGHLLGLIAAAVTLAAASLALAGCGEAEEPPPGGVALKAGGELASWSPDSSLIAAPERDGIGLYRADGSTVRRLTLRGVGPWHGPCRCELGWAGGERILFMHPSKAGLDATVGSFSLDRDSVRSRPLGVPAGDTAWSPRAGWPLIFASGAGRPRAGSEPDLWRLDGLDAEPRRILAQPGIEVTPAFSPDGGRVLYMRHKRGHRSTWVVGVDGSDPHRVAPPLWLAAAVWSPGGERIAVAGGPTGGRPGGIYVVSASGAGEPRRLPGIAETSAGLAWSPDGRWIHYSTGGEFWRVRPNGRDRKRVGVLPGKWVRRLLFSPDGRRLAYAALDLSRIESD